MNNPTDPGSWNRYEYVEGDPENLIDPNGEFGCNPAVCDGYGGGDPPTGLHPILGNNPSTGYPGNPPTGWASLTPTCKQGLQTKMGADATVAQMLAAWTRAANAAPTLEAAVSDTSISWTMLAAIGIRETGFNNVQQVCPSGLTWGGKDCNGYGVFQISINTATGVTTDQAGYLTFAAGWAAQSLNSNMAALAAKFPNFSPTQLLQATAASYNFGTGNISGDPSTIDWGSAPGGAAGNYGSNILALMDCFK